jgi:hypothetical protein
MSNFPPLRLAVLSGLQTLKDHLETLDDPQCPYDNETKGALIDLLAPRVIEKIVEKEIQVEAKAGRGRPTKDVRLSDEDQQTVLTEIKATLEALNAMGTGEGLPTNERIQIAKTKTSLLDQLLKMMERHTTVAKMEGFMETVIGVLDDFVTEEGRETFMKRMEPFR